jgi:serine/threonine protein kinase
MLGVGSRIGVYEITATLGRGGLGEVFRSRDTRLNSVAIKVLPESFASGPERLARFEREAQVLASLNHTNIAHIDGIVHRDHLKPGNIKLRSDSTLTVLDFQLAKAVEPSHSDPGSTHASSLPDRKIGPRSSVGSETRLNAAS